MNRGSALPIVRLFAATWLFAWLPASALAADAQADSTEFFEKRIRPVLAEHCYSCHSSRAEKLKAGLFVDSREGLLQGGDLGPAVIPGNPDQSLFIRAIRHTDADLQMPPKNGKLSERQIADLTQWVRTGAPWPEEASTTPTRVARTGMTITDEDRAWWAFQPIRHPDLPSAASSDPIDHPVDAFVHAALKSKGLKPNPKATPRERIRRVYMDLLGLPPSPEEVEAFESDPSPDAWSRLVDRLLARPQYGERWARHWLDVVRFAQSSGYERDGEKPLAWRYRDYVVQAFNEDKPYDQFIREQIAGDEMEPYHRDAVIATGFQRLGVCDDEPDDRRMAEFDELDDILSTTSSTFLGLTVGCARCHDHKFDPIPQADYYRLLGFFRNLRLNEGARYSLDSGNYLPLAEPEEVHRWQTVRETRLRRLQENLAVATEPVIKEELAKAIEATQAEPAPWEWTLGVRDRGPLAPPTHLLVRGNAATPGSEVLPGFLAVLSTSGEVSPRVPAGYGRRLILANWIASPDNPLTARVLVNRIWHHHFGRGLARTLSDFGRAGSPPSHPELLQWLAADFIAHGWSIKHLHRRLLSSETYQRSSRADAADNLAADPGNDLYWRQNLRRLEAEAMRDTFLNISGELNPKMGGRGFFPRLSGEVLAGQSRPGQDWEISDRAELSRRSLYTFVRRSMMVPILETFDYSNTTSPLSERPTTTVAPQSLLLLNDAFLQQQAQAFAARLVREAGNTADAQVRRGFQLAVGRLPSPTEIELARDFLQRQETQFEGLRPRLTFRPDVPLSLSLDYLGKLRPEQFLVGPAADWRYFRGKWSGAYESIRTLDRDRGPFALWQGTVSTDLVVDARLLPHTALESGGLLFRATVQDDSASSYELLIEPRDQRLGLRRHTDAVVTLATAPVGIIEGQPLSVRVEAVHARIRVWAGSASQPLIDVLDPQPILAPGRVGVRAWGAALSVDDLVVHTAGSGTAHVRDSAQDPPASRALQSFCLLLLNLNEVVYIE
jgi:mono/diheme cytochrome c family protein